MIENGTVLDEKVANPTKNLPILEEFKDSAKIKELTKQYNQLSSELQKQFLKSSTRQEQAIKI